MRALDLPSSVSCVVFVDVENCASIFSSPVEAPLRADVALYLFTGDGVPQLPMLSLLAISPLVKDGRFHVVPSSTAEAAELLLSLYAGALHSRICHDAEFVFVSRLACFDSLVDHLGQFGRKVQRTTGLSLQALAGPKPPTAVRDAPLPVDPKAALQALSAQVLSKREGCTARLQADLLLTMSCLSNPFSYALQIIRELDLKPSEPERYPLRAIPKILVRCLRKQDERLITDADRALARSLLRLLRANAFRGEVLNQFANIFSLYPLTAAGRVPPGRLSRDVRS